MTESHNPPGTLAFVDVETTSTGPDRRAWEVAVIVRRPGADTVEEFHAFVNVDGLALEGADPRALAVGRFHQRHPQMVRQPNLLWEDEFPDVPTEYDVLRVVEWLTRGAQLVAWNVAFDADALDARMRAMGISPSFDYHHIELRSLALGFISGATRTGMAEMLSWPSSQVCRFIGVPEVPEELRHTALGDARWYMDIFDRVALQARDPWSGDRVENLAQDGPGVQPRVG